MIRLVLLFISLLILGNLPLWGQGISTTVELTLLPGDSTLRLPHDFLIGNGFTLQGTSGAELLDSASFALDRRTGIIRLGRFSPFSSRYPDLCGNIQVPASRYKT